MPVTFISYRRHDSAGYAGRLYDAIAARFGKKNVFMDVDSINAGEDFVKAIEKRMAACDVLIAVIGRNWSVDDRGVPRLQNPNDFVRIEIAYALARRIRVIPVLVGGASMPVANALPEDLKPLSTRNALEIHDALFPESVHRLLEELRGGVSLFFNWGSRRFRVAFALGVVSLAGLLMMIFAPGAPPPSKAGVRSEYFNARTTGMNLEKYVKKSSVPIKVKEPGAMAQLPAVVPEARNVARTPGSHDVTGPRQPKVLWGAAVSTGTDWYVEGIAGDGTVFVYDRGLEILSAVREGKELWAYRPYDRWSLDGFDGSGRVWLQGMELRADQSADPPGIHLNKVGYCFNSRGEGGLITGKGPLPRGQLAASTSEPSSGVACRGGAVVSFSGKVRLWTSELDGNCGSLARDAKGNIYTSTDAGTFYSIEPTGAIRWTYRLGFQAGEPLFLCDDVIVAGSHSMFRLHEGALAWTLAVAGSWSGVFDQSGAIYIGLERAIMAVDNGGRALWKYAGDIKPVALDQKGRLYVTGGRGILCLSD